MASRRATKYYVVFKGRRPGIYDSWIDCHAQTSGFKENAFLSYPTWEEAHQAWEAHVGGAKLTVKDEMADTTECSHAGNRAMDVIDEQRGNDFLIEFSMQGMLMQVCSTLGIQGPTYTMHDAAVLNGQRYYRYRASLPTRLIGRPPVSMGRYATTEERAREDVAILLMRRLCASSGRRIGDFNHHNIALYEEQITNLEAENFDLILQNAQLKHEIRAVRRGGNV